MKCIGLVEATGHPLEGPLARFLAANGVWIADHGAALSFRIIKKPWAPALVMVDERLRVEVNRRLQAAGFKTNIPEYPRHADGHLMKNHPTTVATIEILGYKEL